MGWKETGNKFENAPVGTHLARCIKVIDIGTQTGEYKGERTVARKNIIFWELPNELREDGKPFVVSKFYTASLGEKANLRKDLVSWRGREFTALELKNFEEKNILDKGCQVTIIEKENGKTAITAVSGLPKGVTLPDRYNDLVLFLLEDFDQRVYDGLSDGIKKLIRESAEYDSLGIVEEQEYSGLPETPQAHEKSSAAMVGQSSFAVDDDDIPF